MTAHVAAANLRRAARVGSNGGLRRSSPRLRPHGMQMQRYRGRARLAWDRGPERELARTANSVSLHKKRRLAAAPGKQANCPLGATRWRTAAGVWQPRNDQPPGALRTHHI